MASEMTNPKSSLQPDSGAPAETSHNLRLWHEFGTSVLAWLSLNCLNTVVAWRACVHQEQFGSASHHPGARALYFLLWILFFGLASLTGFQSYRTWRQLSGASELLRAEGRERKEYMSLCGLFISVTLGFGFLWLCVPLFILQMCLRTR
jgi:hypothetical protein